MGRFRAGTTMVTATVDPIRTRAATSLTTPVWGLIKSETVYLTMLERLIGALRALPGDKHCTAIAQSLLVVHTHFVEELQTCSDCSTAVCRLVSRLSLVVDFTIVAHMEIDTLRSTPVLNTLLLAPSQRFAVYLARLTSGPLTDGSIELIASFKSDIGVAVRDMGRARHATRLINQLALSDDNRFLRIGQLVKVTRDGPRPSFCFLLNDAFMYAPQSCFLTGFHDPLVIIPIDSSFKIEVMAHCATDVAYMFRVFSAQESFQLEAESKKCRDIWVHQIVSLISAARRDRDTTDDVAQSVRPLMMPLASASACTHCSRKFPRIAMPRSPTKFYCSLCGVIVCRRCIHELNGQHVCGVCDKIDTPNDLLTPLNDMSLSKDSDDNTPISQVTGQPFNTYFELK